VISRKGSNDQFLTFSPANSKLLIIHFFRIRPQADLHRPFKFDKLPGIRFVVRQMKSATRFAVVLVTAPNLKTARMLARAALSARLIACASLIPKIESHYWWRGKIESGAEVLLLLKTARSKLAALENLIVDRHPYETPEFLVLPPSAGNKKYLDWLASF
jgi:periplasmic divalent cation tolerance protein